MSICSDCGRPVLVFNIKTRRTVKPKEDHDLCFRCWKAQVDRNREGGHDMELQRQPDQTH